MDFKGIKQTNYVILMKLTSRSRPRVLFDTVSKYISMAANTSLMKWVLSLDEDDPKLPEYYEISKIIDVEIFINKPSNKILAINSNVPNSGWDILLNISDDQLPVKHGYDEVIRNSMHPSLDVSLWFHDGHQGRINTQEIVGFNYYNRTGYIYNPKYRSFFCDNEATEVAQRQGKLLKFHQCIIKHFHPGWESKSHIRNDSLYQINNKYWKEDEQTFKNRFR